MKGKKKKPWEQMSIFFPLYLSQAVTCKSKLGSIYLKELLQGSPTAGWFQGLQMSLFPQLPLGQQSNNLNG